jgi:hypothetical protein
VCTERYFQSWSKKQPAQIFGFLLMIKIFTLFINFGTSAKKKTFCLQIITLVYSLTVYVKRKIIFTTTYQSVTGLQYFNTFLLL